MVPAAFSSQQRQKLGTFGLLVHNVHMRSSTSESESTVLSQKKSWLGGDPEKDPKWAALVSHLLVKMYKPATSFMTLKACAILLIYRFWNFPFSLLLYTQWEMLTFIQLSSTMSWQTKSHWCNKRIKALCSLTNAFLSEP